MENHSTNLPLQLTSFIGREREMREVKKLLCLATTRFLTLTGVGGCGKTRFALQIASDLLEHFPDGAWLIELASLSDPMLVPQAVAAVFEVRESSDRLLIDALTNYLQSKHLLLVFDNCEHLIEACAQLVETLLHTCSHLRILATSRESFDILGETVWHVPSLSLPDLNELPKPGIEPISTLTQSEAARLFVDRALGALPAFRLTERNVMAIAQICQRLDGMPLAIELAAARVKVLSVEQIAARLNDRFNLLTVGNRTALPRQQTLRATMDWSYDLLTEEERVLFRRLAVFAGGWTLPAAERICSGNGIDSHQVMDLLARLLDKSLVGITEQEGEIRYSFLETVRQYALEKLREAGEIDIVQLQLYEFLLHLLAEAESGMQGAAQTAWLECIEGELDNFRTTLEWSLQQSAKTKQGVGLRLVVAMSEFWLRRNYWKEGREWIARALKEPPDDQLLLPRVKALKYAFQFSIEIGDINAARSHLEENDKLVSRLRDDKEIADLTLQRARLARFEHQLDKSRSYAEESLKQFTLLGDERGMASALGLLGVVERTQGENTTAREHLNESLRLYKKIGDREALGNSLSHSAFAAFQLRDFSGAHSLFKELLTLAEETADKSLMRHALVNLGEVARSAGDDDQAERYYYASLALARELSAKLHAGCDLLNLGYVAVHKGNYHSARQYFRECVTIHQEEKLDWGIATAVEGFASLAAMQGKAESAARLLGAIESYSILDGVMSTPADRIEHERTLAAVQTRLDQNTFDVAWTEGTTMTLEQAVEYALNETTMPEVESPTRIIAETMIPPLQAAPELHISALGLPRVCRGEREITSSDWKYAKTREMFFYLLCYPARTKEQIGLALWPDASDAQLRNNFRVAMYHLRHALGRSEWILFENECYTFNRALPYWFDVETFEFNTNEARKFQANTAAQAIPYLEEAIRLYRGEFLEGWNAGDWHCQRRQELERQYLNALLMLGGLYFAQTQYAQAADVYRKAIVVDGYLEIAHRELMRCYARLGECGQALRHYQGLVELLRDEVGASPAPETQALHSQLREGKAV